MNQQYLSLFLSIVSLMALSTPLEAHKGAQLTNSAIPYETISFTDNLVYDASIRPASYDEQLKVEATLAHPRIHTDPITLETAFIREFLAITERWTEDCAKSSDSEIAKTLKIVCPGKESSEEQWFVIHIILKNPELTAQVRIEGTTKDMPAYLENLVKTAFEYESVSSKLTRNILKASIGSACAVGCIFVINHARALRRTNVKNTSKEEVKNFLTECSLRLTEISKLVPDARITQQSLSPDILYFSTAIPTAKELYNRPVVYFKLRHTNASDKHPSTYVLYNNITADDTSSQMENKLIYTIETADDFTTAILVHLLVRKIDIGHALERFSKAIGICKFKGINVMNQFSWKSSTRKGTLQEALHEYQCNKSLHGFFSKFTRPPRH